LFKKFFGALFFIIVLHCVASAPVAAQTCSPGLKTMIWWWGLLIPDGWFYYSPDIEWGAFQIATWGGDCPPPVFCPTCNSGPNQNANGKPINLTSGNTYVQQMDVKLPGLGNSLTLKRTWNSIWPSMISAYRSGMFGANWRSTYEERVFQSGSYMVYLQGDGATWLFSSTGGTSWKAIAPANIVATLSQGTTYWTLTFQNGEQRQFSVASGSLTSIVDRNGNTTSLSYDGLNRLVTVADPGGRHLYFTYASSSSYLVTGVTSDVTLTLSYAYDTSGRLTQVTKPDSTTNTFQYNANSLITSVLDNEGVVLESHTYDSLGRGLTSSRASGVESISITYP
jgi:YD repeat-containing protein